MNKSKKLEFKFLESVIKSQAKVWDLELIKVLYGKFIDIVNYNKSDELSVLRYGERLAGIANLENINYSDYSDVKNKTFEILDSTLDKLDLPVISIIIGSILKLTIEESNKDNI